MHKYYRLLRFDLPLHVVFLLCSFLPDNVVFLRLRGWLAQWFLGSCGKDFRCGRSVTLYNPSNIHLGDHVYLAYGTWLMGGDKITLGNEVMLGPYCIVAPSNHTRRGNSFRYGSPKTGPISIGDGTWLGAQVIVLRNTTIGSGCVIAANTVVQVNVPDNVAFGNEQSAGILKHLGPT